MVSYGAASLIDHVMGLAVSLPFHRSVLRHVVKLKTERHREPKLMQTLPLVHQ